MSGVAAHLSPALTRVQSSEIELLSGYIKSLQVSRESGERKQLLDELSLDGVARYMQSDKCKHVVVMVGAGMSTSAGVPDFRSPGSGIYASLDVPSPESIFDISFFREDPQPFFELARRLLPSDIKPTPGHYFLKLLSDKSLLSRVYTQNVDCLERQAGIPSELIIEAHGSFHSSHCLNSSCRREYSFEWMRDRILTESAGHVPKCESCGSVVKPDIVFYGERLPEKFFRLSERDFATCDLLIVIGTSLVVEPFSLLVEVTPKHVPRLVINLTPIQRRSKGLAITGRESNAFDFDSEARYRDVFIQGFSDEVCRELSERLGWREELDALLKKRTDESVPRKQEQQQ